MKHTFYLQFYALNVLNHTMYYSFYFQFGSIKNLILSYLILLFEKETYATDSPFGACHFFTAF